MEKKYREVKRVAKVGEKVKIVDAVMSSGRYKKGDILTVTSIENSGVRVDNSIPLYHIEYVVLEEIKEFTLADLKPCMVVKLRSGDIARVEQLKDEIVICNSKNKNSWNSLRYDKDLCYTGCSGNGWDIMKIYGFSNIGDVENLFKTNNRELLFERIEKSPTQLKLEEFEEKQRKIADEIAEIRRGL